MTALASDSTGLEFLLGAASSAEIVRSTLEGQRVVFAFEVDLGEHQRRAALDVGALNSRALVHALWELPSGGSCLLAELAVHDVAALQDGHGFAEMDMERVTRTYRVPGTIHGVAVPRARLMDAVMSAGRLPAIFRRVAVATRPSAADTEAVDLAASVGIGVAVLAKNAPMLLVDPGAPLVGRPGVYRWWLAELAYSGWLQMNAH